MKYKKIAKICKKSGTIMLINRLNADGEIVIQYIGDGVAIYPVVKLPILDVENVGSLFDLAEKDEATISHIQRTTDELAYNLNDYDTGETQVKALPQRHPNRRF